MALEKSITRRGVTANYFFVTQLRYAKDEKSASAALGLCVDAAHRAEVKAGRSQPLESIVAKVRLMKDDFDKYLTTGTVDDDKIIEQIYTAAKDGIGVISDLGSDIFATAQDV
tara:strand:+ start:139 stop:477 length:339 start_codon:yes stop_codon:yes gene_type:complete